MFFFEKHQVKRHRPPGTPPSNPPRRLLGGRFGIDSTSIRHRFSGFDPISMPNSRVPNQPLPLTSLNGERGRKNEGKRVRGKGPRKRTRKTLILVPLWCRYSLVRKIPAPIKNKMGTPPPLERGILWTWRFSCRKNAEILGAHEIGAAVSGPRIADKNFTDTRLFLI